MRELMPNDSHMTILKCNAADLIHAVFHIFGWEKALTMQLMMLRILQRGYGGNKKCYTFSWICRKPLIRCHVKLLNGLCERKLCERHSVEE